MKKGVRAALVALALPLAFAAMGCSATFSAAAPTPTVHGYAAMDAVTVPAAIETYPRVAWGGSFAYLVGGVWYYPSATGWVVLREEPRVLARYRARLERAPRVYRAPPVEYGYPRERRPLPPRELHREYRRY
ncbi:hypothetical protein [Polyangium aurulentum]|uniref:hypothetical protein n=1 Tax=Polyangium aurulentum TaxID=2567896 RepID=UPI0010AE58AD|nr:hypothetical protein [Polyangium aurulentum]UQA61955.1 hypothetical protein E8A73_016370 [Polyangium aurulentum]